MNTRQNITESTGPVSLSASYNEDASLFAVGLDSGFCIFNTAKCELLSSRDFNASIGHIQLLETSNLSALVGGGRRPKYAQNKVILWDNEKQKAVCTLELRTSVFSVRLSRTKIIVALQNSIHIYDFGSPPKKRFVFETADNYLGLCCLGPKVVVFPGQTPGKVQLVEHNTGNVSIIPAHESPLRALELSANGELLATASEKGTLIRVFSTNTSAKVAELRRGLDSAVILSMKFSPNCKMLAVTSDKSNLHIFDLPFADTASSSDGNSVSAGVGKWGILGKIPFLPKAFTDIYSFASAPFDTNDDPTYSGDTTVARPFIPIPGIPGGRAAKGIVCWLDNVTIVVIGAGRDGRWEKFLLKTTQDGKRVCYQEGWKRYLGG